MPDVIRYVDPVAGNDGNDGETSGQAWATLDHARTEVCLPANDPGLGFTTTINILAGTCDENVYFYGLNWGGSLIINGAGISSTTINPAGGYALGVISFQGSTNKTNNLTIQNLTIENASTGSNSACIYLYRNSEDVIIQNCKLNHYGLYGLRIRGDAGADTISDIAIEDIEINSLSAAGVDTGIKVQPAAGNTVANITFNNITTIQTGNGASALGFDIRGTGTGFSLTNYQYTGDGTAIEVQSPQVACTSPYFANIKANIEEDADGIVIAGGALFQVVQPIIEKILINSQSSTAVRFASNCTSVTLRSATLCTDDAAVFLLGKDNLAQDQMLGTHIIEDCVLIRKQSSGVGSHGLIIGRGMPSVELRRILLKGGGLVFKAVDAIVEDVYVSSTAENGNNSLWLKDNTVDSDCLFKRCTFETHSADGNGAAIHTDSDTDPEDVGNMTFENVTFIANSEAELFDLVTNQVSATAIFTFNSCTFIDNSTNSDSGVIGDDTTVGQSLSDITTAFAALGAGGVLTNCTYNDPEKQWAIGHQVGWSVE